MPWTRQTEKEIKKRKPIPLHNKSCIQSKRNQHKKREEPKNSRRRGFNDPSYLGHQLLSIYNPHLLTPWNLIDFSILRYGPYLLTIRHISTLSNIYPVWESGASPHRIKGFYFLHVSSHKGWLQVCDVPSQCQYLSRLDKRFWVRLCKLDFVLNRFPV